MTDSAKSQGQTQPQQAQAHSLPGIELATYLVCFTCFVASAGYAFSREVSDDSLLELSSTSLRDGFLGIKMDNTYLDFNQFLGNFWHLLLTLVAHLLVSQFTLRCCNLQLHHLTCAAFTLALSCRILSCRCTAMLAGLHCCCLLAGFTGSPLAVWSVVLIAFLRFSGPYFGDRDLRASLRLDSRGVHIFYPISGYLYCRFLSMGLCLTARKSAQIPDGGSSFLRRLLQQLRCHLSESLHYAFYLPNFLGGPVVTMDDFLAQRRVAQKPEIKATVFRVCRLVLWLCATLAVAHWFPVGAYLETLGLRLAGRRQPIAFVHVAFAMYTRGQLFMLEYVQYYGWPALFAALDGVKLPHWPACICRVTSYREMWRLFDRGLFSIVREHVYIPLGGSRRGLARQLAATAASFGFICVYHGNYDSVQAWILLNLGLVSAELVAVRAYRGWLEAELLKWTNPRWIRRLTGCLAALNLIPPSVGIFYFFYGTHAGKLLMREVLLKPLTGQASFASFAMFCASFYCSVQLAIEYKIRRRGGPENKD